MLKISNAVAVITGGSGGIGKALAEYWVTNGGKVVLADINESMLRTGRTRLDDRGLTGRVAYALANAALLSGYKPRTAERLEDSKS